MSNDPNEIERRRAVALDAIKRDFESGDSSTSLFVSHHLEEIGDDYWLEKLGSASPESEKVLGLLELKSHWGEEDDEDGIDFFDFSLPGDVTNYLISVAFDDEGNVEEISMES